MFTITVARPMSDGRYENFFNTGPLSPLRARLVYNELRSRFKGYDISVSRVETVGHDETKRFEKDRRAMLQDRIEYLQRIGHDVDPDIDEIDAEQAKTK